MEPSPVEIVEGSVPQRRPSEELWVRQMLLGFATPCVLIFCFVNVHLSSHTHTHGTSVSDIKNNELIIQGGRPNFYYV
jgi:hypothetical protein